jgi:hypothetical protein
MTHPVQRPSTCIAFDSGYRRALQCQSMPAANGRIDPKMWLGKLLACERSRTSKAPKKIPFCRPPEKSRSRDCQRKKGAHSFRLVCHQNGLGDRHQDSSSWSRGNLVAVARAQAESARRRCCIGHDAIGVSWPVRLGGQGLLKMRVPEPRREGQPGFPLGSGPQPKVARRSR